MKSYKKSLCAIVLTAFAIAFTAGLSGCCSTNYPGGGSWFSSEPEYQGPQTMKEYMDLQRPSMDLTKSQ